MTDASPPPKSSVDSVRPPNPEITPTVKRARSILLFIGGGGYAIYLLICMVLIIMFPALTETLGYMVPFGVMFALIGLVIVVAASGVSVMRILQAKVPDNVRNMSLLRTLVFLPGIILGAMVPTIITGEPPIGIDIHPANPAQLIAPLAIDLNLERAVKILRSRGQNPIEYHWDFDGDGQVDQETVIPEVTAIYERQGINNVLVRLVMSDQSVRVLGRRLIIQQAVFSVNPVVPIIEEPVVFSVARLFEDPLQIREIQWDLDGDGEVDEVTDGPSVTYTYFKTGTYTVSAVVMLANQAQTQFTRTIEAHLPPEKAFPIDLKTEPGYLYGASPFGVLFKAETDIPLDQVRWLFGDGTEGEGERIAHTFREVGDYPVTMKARSSDGEIVEISKVVRVVEELKLPDLSFDGTPEVKGGSRISAEVPVTIKLTPHTNTPFVEFLWEVPDATEVRSTDMNLEAVYRRTGTYTITLVGRDADDRVLRKQITVKVNPPSSLVTIMMEPEGGIAPLTVTFDASETFIPGKSISGFEWDFGDQTPKHFGGAQVEHRFVEAGTYNVILTVRTTTGEEHASERTIVVRAPVLDACILPSRTSGNAPLGINFSSDCSVGAITEYLWDFGDGTQSDQPNPVHVFEEDGVYNVELELTDTFGQKKAKTITITVKE
jgi:PKD repeat protein